MITAKTKTQIRLLLITKTAIAVQITLTTQLMQIMPIHQTARAALPRMQRAAMERHPTKTQKIIIKHFHGKSPQLTMRAFCVLLDKSILKNVI